MRGTVEEINGRSGMVAVLTEGGDYSVLELLGDEVEEGDELVWSGDYPLGGESVKNLTQGVIMDVFFQNHTISKSQMHTQLLY